MNLVIKESQNENQSQAPHSFFKEEVDQKYSFANDNYLDRISSSYHRYMEAATNIQNDLNSPDLEMDMNLELKKARNKRHTFLSEDGKFIYYIGVIDYLQDYNFRKMGETFFKRKIESPETKDLISAVHPNLYRNRF
tara:strand:+ start:2617 stop:3027 length:411 start_codon:yes stop_codon:yes gene_type:complete